jgi:hypothetical protein
VLLGIAPATPKQSQMEITFIPPWILSCLSMDEERQLHFNCALSALLIVVTLPLLSVIPHICLAQTLLGIPCPGCGITHALTAMARLDLRLSWNSNPAGMALALLFIFQLVVRPLALFIPETSRTVGRAGRWLSTATGIALMAVWIERVL